MTDNDYDVVAHLSLERLEDNLFRGDSRDIGTQRVFGGQVLGQALRAAAATVDGRQVHSLHAYFLREGDHGAPIVYEVDRSRDGRSFSARRVVAIQHGAPIFTLSSSFQVPEPGLEHQSPMPDVPPPEDLSDVLELNARALASAPPKLQRFASVSAPFDFRPVEQVVLDNPGAQKPWKNVWIKSRQQLPDERGLHVAMLAYVSDYGLLSTALLPHGADMFSGRLQIASIDHAMWFHRDFRMDEWLLYSCTSLSTSGARGLARGFVFRRSGELVATAVQEGLMREVRR